MEYKYERKTTLWILEVVDKPALISNSEYTTERNDACKDYCNL